MDPMNQTGPGDHKETPGRPEADTDAYEIATAAKAYTVGGDGRCGRTDDESAANGAD